MKAVVLKGYGGVDQIAWEQVSDPKLDGNQVLIQVQASSINPIDYKLRAGHLTSFFPIQFPYILGWDVAGVVKQAPSGSRFEEGDRVLAMIPKAHAEFAAVKETDLSRMPDGLDVRTAGVLPLVLLTGYQLITESLRPKMGDTILVTGAIGGVGRSALYVAKQLGAKVIAGVRSRQKEQASDLQADEVVALDDESELGSLANLDGIADVIGGSLLARLVSAVRPGGVIATAVGANLPNHSNIDLRMVQAHPESAALEHLTAAVHRGELNIPIAATLLFSEIREAHRLAETGIGGKVQLIA